MDGWKWNGGAGRVCLNLEPANIPSSSKFYAWPYRFFCAKQQVSFRGRYAG